MLPPRTRRDFAKLTLAALPALGLLSSPSRLRAAASQPNSKVAGVQIGLNVPYSFGSRTMGGDETLQKCLQLGISAVELRSQPVEEFLGASVELLTPAKGSKNKEGKNKEASQAKDAPKSADASQPEQLRTWRRSAPLAKASEFRAQWEAAGVLIEIVKFDGVFTMSDEELDYSFALAKALGARALSTEISHDVEELKRVGAFADKHQFWVGYHGHTTTAPEHWEAAFAVAKYNGANVDLGHFVAGNNTSPVPFLQKYHDRITHVHIKDRKFHDGPDVPFGEGDTPLVEVLHLLRDQKWNIQATIEFEYKIPEGSDRMTEIARTIKYCREVLA